MNYWSVLCTRPGRVVAATDRQLLAEPRSSAGPALSPGHLAGIVTGVARDHDSWLGLVRYGAARRWYCRVVLAQDHEVWLLSWLPGQGTGFHDHGDSAGAFTVIQGSLRERAATGGRPAGAGRVLRKGSVRSFGRSYVHDVGNVSAEPAVSIHAYSPPLAGMRRFELVGGQLRQASAGEEVRTW